MPRAIQSFKYGPHPVLITWPPSSGYYVPAVIMGRDDRIAELLQRLRRQHCGKAVQQIRHRPVAVYGSPKVGQPNLTRSTGEGLVA